MLKIAATLCLLIGVIHSYLGDRYIIRPIIRKDVLPKLFGSTFFAGRTLRFAWHTTTVAWWGFGWLLWGMATSHDNVALLTLNVTATVFLITGVFAFVFTKGKHLSWVVFWAISGLCYCATF